jgi:hypothetical protein
LDFILCRANQKVLCAASVFYWLADSPSSSRYLAHQHNIANALSAPDISVVFIHAALISAMFIRPLSALLVAPLQFRATKGFVSLHCFALRRPPAWKAGSLRFDGAVLLSPGRGEESNPAPSNETQKNEHDRKLRLNASSGEQHRQANQIPTATAGMENCFIAGMSDTRRHSIV